MSELIIPAKHNDFKNRAMLADKFSKRIFDDLKSWGYEVALNGTEHTHPDFVEKIQQSEDQTSLMIRHQPDGVVCDDAMVSAYIEAKRSKYIEKNAYQNYLNLQKIGASVFVVFGIPGKKYVDIGFCKIEALHFKPLNQYNKWPIIDGWMCPRERPDWKQIKLNGFPGSGTPYREINPNSLIPWQSFVSFFAHSIA